MLNKATHYGALLGYATGTDGRIIGYRIYNYDTNRFVYPYNVTFNDDCPAIPYIASIRQLAPPVRLHNRVVSKQFNGTTYMGKITHIREDTDGEIIYGVTYSDSDYEEYNFKEVMEILQAYNPLDDIDDTLEITPFFGSSSQHKHAVDKVAALHAPATATDPNAKASHDKQSKKTGTRKSSRVRVVRRPYNAPSGDRNEIPSSLNRHRLRYAMKASAQTCTSTNTKPGKCNIARRDKNRANRPKPTLKPMMRAVILERAKLFEDIISQCAGAAPKQHTPK